MKVCLVRHAIAIDRDAPNLISDAARELTTEGIEKMRRNARAIRKIGMVFDAVWSSPLIRARQTAEILADAFDPKPPVEVVRALEPAGHFEDLLLRLQERKASETIALVGHEPSLGELASFMIGGPRNVAIPFKKGGAACIVLEELQPPLRGELLWLLTPKIMSTID